MINQLFLVGIIKELPSYDETNKDNSFAIEVRRNYKNVDGVFETDLFKCHLWIAISKKIMLCCKEGDIVAVKGRIINDEGVYTIVAEQIVLLNKMGDVV